MRVRTRLLILLAGASLSCARPSPSQHIPDWLVLDAYRLYANGDCAALRTAIERADLSAARPQYQVPFDLLLAFCAEREGEILSAKDRYAAEIAKSPRNVQAYEAALRLRELERLEKQGTTREELKRRAEEQQESPLYQHGTKPLVRGSPSYPPGPLAAGIGGVVLVDFAISRDGSVTDLVVLASDPPFVFDGTALSAVRNWLYESSDRDEPRRVMVKFPFSIAPPADSSTRVAARVDESKLNPIERRGRELYEIELATDRASNALLLAGHVTSLWNWIAVRDESGWLVRFIDPQDRAFADVRVDVFSSEPEQMTIHDPPVALSGAESDMSKARIAALAFAKKRSLENCNHRHLTVVLPSLDPIRSWDVYLVSIPTDDRIVPIGGHYRISVSRDPSVPPELHAFAESCAQPTSSPESERLLITEPTSTTPTEVHVYLSLRYGRPLGVVVRGENPGLWFIEHGRMWRADDSPGES